VAAALVKRMNWDWQRPALWLALLFAGGILLADKVNLLPATLLVGAAGFLLLALGWRRGRAAMLAVGIFLAGMADLSLHTAVLSPQDVRALQPAEPQLAVLRGRLVRTPELRAVQRGEKVFERALAELDVTDAKLARGEWQAAQGRVAVSATGRLSTNYFGGQIVEVAGVLDLPPRAIAEGNFDYRELLRRKGIFRQLTSEAARDWTLVSSPAQRPLADRFRDWARTALTCGLPREDETLRLEWALTLGDKGVLSPEVSEPFVQAATFHIFAVDGLRLAIVFGIFFALLKSFHVPREIAGAILLPLVWAYVALTGWPASAIRAAVMLSVVIAGWVTRRPGDLFNSLFVAALIILAWEPPQLFQAGFQLSFFVVLAILVIMPPLDALAQKLLRRDPLLPDDAVRGWKKYLQSSAHFAVDILLVSFAAWVGSIPLAAYYFNIFTPVSTPANLLAVPACALVLACNFLSLIFAAWLPAVAELFNHSGWFLMDGIRVASSWCAGWPGAFQYVAAPTWFGIGAYYFFLLALVTGWLWRGQRLLKISGAVILLGAWAVNFYANVTTTHLTVLPLGPGSATFCDAPGAATDALIDCGNEVPADYTLKPFLRSHGVDRLPRLLLTHGDSARVGGAARIIELFAPEEVLTSHAPSRSPVYRQVIAQLERDQRTWHKVARSDHFGSWLVLHPERAEKFPEADDNAVVLMGIFQGVRVLLLSDLGVAGQAALLARQGDLQAEVVVLGIPQHGEPMNNVLLNAINPRLIIVTDAETPPARRASAAVRERLGKWGVPVVYLRQTGAAKLDITGGSWRVETMDGQRWKF
jgi:competence protein ComEC